MSNEMCHIILGDLNNKNIKIYLSHHESCIYGTLLTYFRLHRANMLTSQSFCDKINKRWQILWWFVVDSLSACVCVCVCVNFLTAAKKNKADKLFKEVAPVLVVSLNLLLGQTHSLSLGGGHSGDEPSWTQSAGLGTVHTTNQWDVENHWWQHCFVWRWDFWTCSLRTVLDIYAKRHI